MDRRHRPVRIVQINVVHGKGSTGRITSGLHTELRRRGHESLVLYGRGATATDSAVVKTSSEIEAKWNAVRARIVGMQYDGCRASTARIVDELRSFRPDVVHLQCLNGYFLNIYELLDFLRSSGQPTVLTLHAEFMFTGGCGHSLDCDRWKLTPGCGKCPQLRLATKSLLLDRTREGWERMHEAFANFHDRLVVTSVSPWLQARAAASPILGSHRHVTVLNGLDTKIFRPRDFSDAVRRLDHPNPARTLLHVTPYFTTNERSFKGGKDIVALAEQLGPEYRLIVVGTNASRGPLPRNITCTGRVDKPEELAALYSLATATVLTSRRETFSMVCAESLACGTPVVGYKSGGPEQIALPQYSHFVEQGDVNALADVAIEVSSAALRGSERAERASAIHAAAHNAYSMERMADEFEALYRELLGTGN